MNRQKCILFKIISVLILFVIIVTNNCKAHIYNPSVLYENPDDGNRNKEADIDDSEDLNKKQKSATELPPSLQIRYNPQKGEFMNKTKQKSKMTGFIYGGEFTNIASHPHVAFLTVDCSEQYWICGASIINQDILLTAAHCVYGCLGKFHIEVLVGSDNLNKANIRRKVRRYIMHERYNDNSVKSDIALVQVAERFPLGKNIARVIIRDSFDMKADGMVAGWGVINKLNKDSPNLKRVRQVVQPKSVCSHLNIEPGMMCVFSGLKGNHPAGGDSGSGLVINFSQLIGIVSFSGLSKPDLIIYSNVSYYYQWLKSKSIKLYCAK